LIYYHGDGINPRGRGNTGILEKEKTTEKRRKGKGEKEKT